jgi:aspartate racemase
MKTIGLIGGMSWSSTLEYYRLINEMVAEKLGHFHSARLVLYSLDFEEIECAQRQARWEAAADILTEAGVSLKRAGADFLVICTNTMHKIANNVAQKSGLPLLHIVDVVGSVAREQGLDTVGLLGTKFVMGESFYRERLQRDFGIHALVPREDDQATIHRIIYDELCQGDIKDSSRRACLGIIDGLKEDGAQGVILGCTELPLLIRLSDLGIPVLDTTLLHTQAAVSLALA